MSCTADGELSRDLADPECTIEIDHDHDYEFDPVCEPTPTLVSAFGGPEIIGHLIENLQGILGQLHVTMYSTLFQKRRVDEQPDVGERADVAEHPGRPQPVAELLANMTQGIAGMFALAAGHMGSGPSAT